MYFINQLVVVEPSRAKGGTLLLQRIGQSPTPALVATVRGGEREIPSLLYLRPSDRGEFAFQAAAVNLGNWLAVDRWELQVDPASSFDFTQSEPRPGDAFLWAGEAGLTGITPFGAVCVTTAGIQIEPQPQDNFVGFRRWQILVWSRPDGEPLLLVDRKPD